MKANDIILTAVCSALLCAGPAFARGGPPAGIGGPPPGVTLGPPPAAQVHIPADVAVGTDVNGSASITGQNASAYGRANADLNTSGSADVSAANILGNLNAAHASTTAQQHASVNSIVSAVAAYKTAMQSALAQTDTTVQANDITAARIQLASASNKQLTADAITKVDGILGISGADPTLGTTP